MPVLHTAAPLAVCITFNPVEASLLSPTATKHGYNVDVNDDDDDEDVLVPKQFSKLEILWQWWLAH